MTLFLLICIIVNTLIVVIFKLFDRFNVDLFPAITINYLTCVITGSIAFSEWPFTIQLFEKKWLFIALILGATFICVFNLVGRTVASLGLTVATIFQKISLIAPAIIGMVFYSEASTLYKILGICLAVLAILFISHPEDGKFDWRKMWLPIAVFLGSSLIEVTLYYVNAEQVVSNADPNFVITLFGIAGIFGVTYLLFNRKGIKRLLGKKELLAGISLGIPNFFSIYLVLFLLKNGWEGSELFPILNVSILTLSALAGIFFFTEKLDLLKKWGFLFALLAIVLISL